MSAVHFVLGLFGRHHIDAARVMWDGSFGRGTCSECGKAMIIDEFGWRLVQCDDD